MSYADEVKTRLRRIKSGLPTPWRIVSTAFVGGLIEVGYAPKSDLVLVVSHDGRGGFDAKTGEHLARDRSPSTDPWFDPISMTASGIGPLEGVVIRLAGLSGGGLPKSTADGWRLETAYLDWPDACVFISSPGANPFDEQRSAGCTRIPINDGTELRACGFSETGRTFVIATNSDIVFYCRP